MNSEECSICLDELKNSNETIYILECSHKYHESCLNLWYNQPGTNYICPLCMVPREITKIIYVDKTDKNLNSSIEPMKNNENNRSNSYSSINIEQINLDLDIDLDINILDTITPPPLENLYATPTNRRHPKKKNNCVIC